MSKQRNKVADILYNIARTEKLDKELSTFPHVSTAAAREKLCIFLSVFYKFSLHQKEKKKMTCLSHL